MVNECLAAANTVIPAKAGIQYPDNGMGSTA